MVFGLCAAHKEELMETPHRATNTDVSGSALGSATKTQVSVRKQKLIQMKLFIILL